MLGESYLRLLHNTRERSWGDRLLELVQLRRAQASAALNQALVLNAHYAQAHLSLSRLYGEMGYLDLALQHLRRYVELGRNAAPVDASAEVSRQELAQYEDELGHLAREVTKREDKYVVVSVGWTVLERALKAWQLGLAGKARDLLLESNIAAFGDKGLALELELLLRTGRPTAVQEWTAPEHKAMLGPAYYWLRAQALAASGKYAASREEIDEYSRALSGAPRRGKWPNLREGMATRIGQRVLGEMPAVGQYLMDVALQVRDRMAFEQDVLGLAQRLRREADMTVLRGLIALEQGDVEEAEVAFREALSMYKSQAAVGPGAGMDFPGRPVTQAGLDWLK